MSIKQRGVLFHILDVAMNIIVIVAVVVAIRTFLVSPFQVEGNSMVDTLENKEYIIINKFAYLVGDPVRGDIVVFRPPTDHDKFYVKRVIGLPGDSVKLESGWVFVKHKGEESFEKLDETAYLNPANLGHTYRHPPNNGDGDAMVYDIPDGRYFLLGDNRRGSQDSRSFMGSDGKPSPFVTQKDVKGRVWFVALPISKIQAFEAPAY